MYVLAGTVVGLAGVLGFHTSPAKIVIGVGPPTSAPGTTRPPTTTARTAAHSNPTTTAVPSSNVARTATGPVVNYYFGTLSVSVTATGKKINKVTIASLNDGGNLRSRSIDQQSLPMLQQQALAAQSARIQGVSGASYTSAGFAQSLQSALKKLGV